MTTFSRGPFFMSWSFSWPPQPSFLGSRHPIADLAQHVGRHRHVADLAAAGGPLLERQANEVLWCKLRVGAELELLGLRFGLREREPIAGLHLDQGLFLVLKLDFGVHLALLD